jgi:ketosteroid isomerase-like protein
VHTSPDQIANESVKRVYRAYLQAMIDGDIDALDAMLDADFTLTHITGYLQSRAEWLSQMRAGQFDYHAVTQENVTVEVEGDTARLVGRITTDSTVYGTRANWRLLTTIDYARAGETWIALRSAATTW